MNVSSRSFSRFGQTRCSGPSAFRPVSVRVYPTASTREAAEPLIAGRGFTSAGELQPQTSWALVVGTGCRKKTIGHRLATVQD